MAVRFNLDKFNHVRQSYISYISTGKSSTDMLQLFAAYKPYLEADEEVRNVQRSIKSKKEADRRRAEEQRDIAKTASTTKKEQRASSSDKRKRRVPSSPIRKNHVHMSPAVGRLNDVKNYDDLKSLMSSSFLETLKSDDDLAVMRSTIVRYTVNHEDERSAWLKKAEQRRVSLQIKVVPKHNEKYINPKAIIIPTPMGGQNKRY